MDTAKCSQCGAVVPTAEIEYTLVGSYCKKCHVAEQADAPRLERAFLRSIGRRQLIIGLVMIALGIALFAFGVAGNSTIVVIPAGLLVAGFVEAARGMSNLSSNP